VAVPDQPQQQPTPVTRKIIRAAAAGKAAQVAVGTAPVTVTLPAGIVSAPVTVPAKAFVHGVKIAIILSVLRKLLRRTHAESADWLTEQLRKQFPDADPLWIRQAVEQELAYERAFQAKSLKRTQADLIDAGKLDGLAAQQARVQAILQREKHYAGLRQQAMMSRATASVQNAQTKQNSPGGALWLLGPRKTHTPGCVAMSGKAWSWDVLDHFKPPVHTGCGCTLVPLPAGTKLPPTGEQMTAVRAAMALEEAIRAVADPGEVEAFLDGLEVRPSIARAMCELTEIDWKEWLHPRGRGGLWIDLPGGGKSKEKELGKAKYAKPDYFPALSKHSTVVSGPEPSTLIGGDVPAPEHEGLIPSYRHIPLELHHHDFATGAHSAKSADGQDFIVQDHGGDHTRVASDLLSNAIYRTLGVSVPKEGSVRTHGAPDFSQIPDALADEPPIDAPKNARISTGVIMREPDGRITIVEPRNHYAGYIHTFPKGGTEPNLTTQQNALKETWEETGLHAHITGVVGDFKSDTGTGVTRYYLGVRVGGEATPSDESEGIKTVTPEEAAQMLNTHRDQEVLKAVEQMPIPTGSYPDNFPPTTPGLAVASPKVPGKTKAINSPNDQLGRDYMVDALLANRDFLGKYGQNVRWGEDGKPTRTSMGSTLGYRLDGSRGEFGSTPEEIWKMRFRGQAAGTVPFNEDDLRAQAKNIAHVLSDAKIDQLVAAAPFPSNGDRKQIAKALKARVQWMRDFADGKVSLPKPVEGEDARQMFLDGQKDFEVYPEEAQALDDYAGDAGKALDHHLRGDAASVTDADRKTAKRLDDVLDATNTGGDSYVYMGADAAPNQDMVGKTFGMKSYTRAHTDQDEATGNSQVKLLVPGGHRALYLDDTEPGDPDVLLPRDARIQMTGLSTGTDGKPMLEGTVLPYRRPKALTKPYTPPATPNLGWHGGQPKPPSKPKGEFFEVGARVDVNGNKATVTGDNGKGMANVKLDNGKGYTVPYAILKRLEEVAWAEFLHPRGRGGEWIKSGRVVRPKTAHVERFLPEAHDTPPVASAALKAAHAGGGTLEPQTGKSITTGVAVALDPKYSKVIPGEDWFSDDDKAEAALMQWMDDNHEVFQANPKVKVGIWHNPETNDVWLDPSEVVDDRDQAIQLGRQRNQISVYDIGAGEEIPTGGTGHAEEARSDDRATEANLGNERGRETGTGPPDRGAGTPERAQALLEGLTEADWDEALHPRGRGGEWIGKFLTNKEAGGRIADSLHHWQEQAKQHGNWDEVQHRDDPTRDKIAANWTKGLRGRLSKDRAAIGLVADANAENEANPRWKALTANLPKDHVLVTTDPEGGTEAASRVGGTTMIGEDAVNRVTDEAVASAEPKPERRPSATSGYGLDATLRHEYGHAIDDALSRDERQHILDAIPDATPLSYYARFNQEHGNDGEVIPELVATITHPDYHAADWPESVQEAQRRLQTALGVDSLPEKGRGNWSKKVMGNLTDLAIGVQTETYVADNEREEKEGARHAADLWMQRNGVPSEAAASIHAEATKLHDNTGYAAGDWSDAYTQAARNIAGQAPARVVDDDAVKQAVNGFEHNGLTARVESVKDKKWQQFEIGVYANRTGPEPQVGTQDVSMMLDQSEFGPADTSIGELNVGDYYANYDDKVTKVVGPTTGEGTPVDDGSGVKYVDSRRSPPRLWSRDEEKVGTIQRDFHTDDNGDLVVEHTLAELGRKYQGLGFMSHFNDHMENVYRQQGVKRIKVHAALDVGGYAWAREGFEPDAYNPWFRSVQPGVPDVAVGLATLEARNKPFSGPALERMKIRMNDPWTDYSDAERKAFDAKFPRWKFDGPANLSPDEQAAMNTYRIEQPPGGFTSIADVAAYGIENAHQGDDGRQHWIGKDFLLGSDWYGHKDLTGQLQEWTSQALADRARELAAKGLIVRADDGGGAEDDRVFWMPELTEADWEEFLHPRGRGGEWIGKGGPELKVTDLRRKVGDEVYIKHYGQTHKAKITYDTPTKFEVEFTDAKGVKRRKMVGYEKMDEWNGPENVPKAEGMQEWPKPTGKLVPGGKSSGEIFKPLLDRGLTGQDIGTHNLHGDGNGAYTKARRRDAHNPIIRKAFTDKEGNAMVDFNTDKDGIITSVTPKVPLDETPKALFMFGGTAAGKSSALKKAESDVVPRNAVTLDPDDIKVQLPEYKQMMGDRKTKTLPNGKTIQVPIAPDRYAAAGVHEESSALSKYIQKMAQDARMNIVVDGTGDSDAWDGTNPSKFGKKIIAASDKGYEPSVFGVNAPTDVAVASATKRARVTGRWVPEPEIRKIHRTVSANVPEVQHMAEQGIVKRAQFWDRSSGDMKRIGQVDPATGKLNVLDPQAWQAMLDKAKE